MAATIANMLYIVPTAVAHSLLAEGSHNQEEIRGFVRRAAKIIAGLLIPAVGFILLFDKYLLSIFGSVYATHSRDILSLMALTSLFLGINMVCETILQVRHEIKKLIIMSTGYLIVTMALSFWMLNHHGVIGAAWALLLGQAFMSLEYLILFGWKRLIRP